MLGIQSGIRKSSCPSSSSSSSSGRAALLFTLALNFGVYKYDPSLLDSSGKELPFMFSTLLIIVIAAICIQWQFACFGTIYNGELISFVTLNTARGCIEHGTPQYVVMWFNLTIIICFPVHEPRRRSTFKEDPSKGASSKIQEV